MNNPKPSPSSNPFKGFTYFLSGFALITQRGVRIWVLLPLSINSLLFGAVLYYAYTRMQQMISYFEQLLPSWLTWLSTLLVPIFILSLAMLVFFSFTLLANLIASPFNSALAAAVEKHLTGRAPENISSDSIWNAVWGFIKEELQKQFYAISRLLILFILFFIPLLQLVAPVLMFVFSAWLLTLQYADYPMGNHALVFKQQRDSLWKKRVLSLSFGATALGATLIPGLNLLVMPVAVAGATQMWLREFAHEST